MGVSVFKNNIIRRGLRQVRERMERVVSGKRSISAGDGQAANNPGNKRSVPEFTVTGPGATGGNEAVDAIYTISTDNVQV